MYYIYESVRAIPTYRVYRLFDNAHRQMRRRKAGEWTSRRPRNFAALEMSPQAAAP